MHLDIFLPGTYFFSNTYFLSGTCFPSDFFFFYTLYPDMFFQEIITTVSNINKRVVSIMFIVFIVFSIYLFGDVSAYNATRYHK